MNGHDVLHETALLIGKGWCRGADARDCFGLAVAASDPAATAWSLLAGASRSLSHHPPPDEPPS